MVLIRARWIHGSRKQIRAVGGRGHICLYRHSKQSNILHPPQIPAAKEKEGEVKTQRISKRMECPECGCWLVREYRPNSWWLRCNGLIEDNTGKLVACPYERELRRHKSQKPND